MGFYIFAQKFSVMHKYLRATSGLILLIILFSSCSSNNDYQEHTSGLKYKFIEMHPKGEMPESGDILLLSIKFVTEGGLIVDENSSYRVQLKKPTYQGDLFTGLAIMQVGDSAHLMLNADDYYNITRKRDLPEEFVEGDKLIIQVKLKNIISVESLETERRGIYHTDEEQEMNLLRDYIERTSVEVRPTESGMYVVILDEGTGPLVLPGQTVSAHYTGKTIDGIYIEYNQISECFV